MNSCDVSRTSTTPKCLEVQLLARSGFLLVQSMLVVRARTSLVWQVMNSCGVSNWMTILPSFRFLGGSNFVAQAVVKPRLAAMNALAVEIHIVLVIEKLRRTMTMLMRILMKTPKDDVKRKIANKMLFLLVAKETEDSLHKHVLSSQNNALSSLEHGKPQQQHVCW